MEHKAPVPAPGFEPGWSRSTADRITTLLYREIAPSGVEPESAGPKPTMIAITPWG